MAFSSVNAVVQWVGAGRSILLCAVILSGLSACSGCDRGPAMYEVRGHVFYPDGSVPRAGVAVVRLQPADNSTAEVRRGASGAITSDGSFELTTRMPGDGVYAGEYVVTFVVQKGVMDQTPLIRDKYMRPDTSPYTVTVDGDIEDLKFEIEPLPGVAGSRASASTPDSRGRTAG